MYVLDTNIFSEIIKQQPNAKVMTQFKQNELHIYLATVVWHELIYGTLTMPSGKKREQIAQFFYEEVAKFPSLSYTKACADIHATIRAQAKSAGTPIAFVDSQIAAIAMANNMVLVTRNIKDFAAIKGLKLANWFE